jgi:SagB-type dehydrogenase family enzyme
MENLNKILRGLIICLIFYTILNSVGVSRMEQESLIKLTQPVYDSSVSLEESILKRRSIRRYKNEPLTINEVSQLMWAAQGITDSYGLRTAPSAGALYPLEIYVVVGNVNELTPGIYKYKPNEHELLLIEKGDNRGTLSDASLGQRAVENGAIVIVISAVYERTTWKYRDRGVRYVHMEVGHVGQNISLQAVSLGLGTVVIGAFSDNEVKRIMKMPEEESPLYIMPVGRI